jgi:hypothetical protein
MTVRMVAVDVIGGEHAVRGIAPRYRWRRLPALRSVVQPGKSATRRSSAAKRAALPHALRQPRSAATEGALPYGNDADSNFGPLAASQSSRTWRLKLRRADLGS